MSKSDNFTPAFPPENEGQGGLSWSQALDRLAHSLDAARAEDPHLPASWLAALLAIARHGSRPRGLSIRDLSDILGISYTSVAEMTKKMAKPGRRFEDASDWIVQGPDPMDDRRKLLKLGPKGLALVKRMEALNTPPYE